MTSPPGGPGARRSKLFMETAGGQAQRLLSCFRCGFDGASSWLGGGSGGLGAGGRRRKEEGWERGWGEGSSLWALGQGSLGTILVPLRVCPASSTLNLGSLALHCPLASCTQSSGTRWVQTGILLVLLHQHLCTWGACCIASTLPYPWKYPRSGGAPCAGACVSAHTHVSLHVTCTCIEGEEERECTGAGR